MANVPATAGVPRDSGFMGSRMSGDLSIADSVFHLGNTQLPALPISEQLNTRRINREATMSSVKGCAPVFECLGSPAQAATS